MLRSSSQNLTARGKVETRMVKKQREREKRNQNKQSWTWRRGWDERDGRRCRMGAASTRRGGSEGFGFCSRWYPRKAGWGECVSFPSFPSRSFLLLPTRGRIRRRCWLLPPEPDPDPRAQPHRSFLGQERVPSTEQSVAQTS